MLKRFLSYALLLSLSVIATPAFAVNCQTLDQELATALEEADKYSSYGDNHDEEKLNRENLKISLILQDLGEFNSSIICSFSQAQEHGLAVVTSADNRVRAFSWDGNTGGTMHEYIAYIQYITDNGTAYIQPLNTSDSVTSLFTTNVKNKPLYLLTTTGIYSTGYSGQALKLYQIQDDKLVSPKLIKTKEGVTDKLSFAYNFFSVMDRPERPIKLFEFNEKSNTIRFPVIVEDKEFIDGKVTNRFITYGFDGNYFIRK